MVTLEVCNKLTITLEKGSDVATTFTPSLVKGRSPELLRQRGRGCGRGP